MREMYAGKTRKRLDAMDQSSGDFAPFFAPRVHVNGADVMGLERVFAVFEDVARRVGLYEQSFFTVIHGDLCMSNILFDRRNACIRMIDPRGSFGDYDIYGDPRYDLAKLAHSFLGDYDFFVNDMFQCSFHGREFRYRPHRTPRHTALQGMFDRWLRRRAGDAYEQVRLIESLLFLSMVPLHRDRPLSQRAFLAQGLTTFTDVVARAGVR
jgi:thiamine kinase-like enzyme